MPRSLGELLAEVRRFSGTILPVSDAELLRLFSESHDETAFEVIIARHGRTVLEVCRGHLPNWADVEDAFQATFLVLACQASSVRDPDALGRWLFGVASRIARKARHKAEQCRRREAKVQPSMMSVETADPAWSETQAIIRYELSQVAERYRLPLENCYLYGRTQDESAALLGFSKGTFRRRLERGRAILRERLVRRGLGPTAALSVAAWPAASRASGVIPSALIKATAAMAVNYTAHETATISHVVSSLTQGVLYAMYISKIMTRATAALLLIVLAASAWGLSVGAEEKHKHDAPPTPEVANKGSVDTEAQVPKDTPAAKQDKPTTSVPPAKGAIANPLAKEGRIRILKEGKDLLLTPDGKQISESPSDRKKYALFTPEGKRVEIPVPDKAAGSVWAELSDPCFSPDGKRVAFIATESMSNGGGRVTYLRNVLVHELGDKGQGFKIEIAAQNLNLAWAPDGKLLAVEAVSMKDKFERIFTTWLVDIGTKEKTKIDLPEGVQVFAATPDGKSFIAVTYDAAEKKLHLASITRDGKKVTHLTEIRVSTIQGMPSSRPQLAPDGTRILFADIDREEKLEEGMTRFLRLYLYDMKTQKKERLVDVPLNAWVWEFAWSPDSKRVAYVWKRMEPGVSLTFTLDKKGNYVDKDGKPDPKIMTETETHLSVADADGKNSKTILSAKGKAVPTATLMKLDWR
jgi:RNA polymerase sigma factor (sigma-70 family)